MAEVFVYDHKDRSLIDFLDNNKTWLGQHGYQALYSGTHIDVNDDEIHIFKKSVQIATIRPDCPYVIICPLIGCEEAEREIILKGLKMIFSAFTSEVPVLIETY